MASNRYAVIEFDDGVSLAAEKWVTPRKTHCYWPPYRTESKLLKAVENQEDPADNWPMHDIIKILASTKTFKRGQAKCSEALVMSDINTDSELDHVRSKKSAKKSSVIIGPFPSVDLDDAACSSSNNEDSDIETIEKKSTSKARVQSDKKDPIPHRNKQSVIDGTLQSNLIHGTRNDGNKTVLTAMAKIDLKIDALTAEVRNIALTLAAKTTDEEIDKTESQVLKAYPLTKEADLAVVEQRLSTDANYKNTLIKDLAIFVQSDVKNTVSKLMHELMSNALAANYSFHGAQKKKSFEKLKLYDVVSSVVRCRFTKPLVVNKEISDPIMSWLRHAPARFAREEKKAETTNDVKNLEIADDEGSSDRINNNGKRQVNKKVVNSKVINNTELLSATANNTSAEKTVCSIVNREVVDNSVVIDDSTDKNLAKNNNGEIVDANIYGNPTNFV